MRGQKSSIQHLLFLLIAVVLFFLCDPIFAKKEPLNVLLITVDTLRADYLGCYGNRRVKTPSIDSLAKAGILFTQAYAHNVVTLPSHANILTGTYPIFHGVRDDIGYRLGEKFVTLAEILKEKGYKTAAFVGAFVLDSRFGLNQGFDLYDDFYGPLKGMAEFSMVERRAEQVVKPALKWLRSHEKSRWFCWIHLFDPHIPYQPPPPYQREYRDDLYAGEVVYVDFWLGKLFTELRSRGLDKKALIVLTSDHGESLGEHGEKTHGIFAYNSTLRIPLIFCQPLVFPSPKIISQRVRHIDILPSILEVLGIDFPQDIQGHSLLSLIKNPKKWKVDNSYFEAMSAHLNSDWAPLEGILSGEFKYIHLPIPELYDLDSDPQEMRNLAGKRKPTMGIMDEKLKKLKSDYSRVSSPRVKRRREEAETLEKLEALGYVGGGGTKPRERHYSEEDDPKKLIHLHNRMLDAIDCFYDEGNAEKAIKIFKDILSKRPTFSRIYSHLSFIYHQQGRLSDAIETLEKALRLGIEERSILSKLGVYYQEAGRFGDSSKILEYYIDRYPDDEDAHNYLGVSYWKLGRLEKAVDTFKKLLAANSTHASAHNNLGSVYLSQREFSLAIKEFKKAIQYAPRMAAAYNGLGVAYAQKNLYDEAIENWKKAVELDAQQFDALYNLCVMLTKKGEFKLALQYIDRFINNAPPDRYGEDIRKMKQLRERLKSKNNR